MSCENHNLEDQFKVVKYKTKSNRSRKKILKTDSVFKQIVDSTNNKEVIRKVRSTEADIKTTDLFDSVKASLTEGLSLLNKLPIKEIICFGLGKFGECMISRYQLALLCCLKELYNVKVKIYDPIFDQNDFGLLNELGFEVLTENMEGKYEIKHLNGLTLFYLPHCPKQLTNNLLWSNWSLKLSNCIIISNSFNKVIETNSKRHVNKNAYYIMSILPYVLELAIINTFKFYEIFNDMAIHIFPIDKISLLPNDFWLSQIEPTYDDDDVEFIKSKCIESLNISE